VPFSVQFVPWRGDFARGIFVSSTFKTSFFRRIFEVYENFYEGQIFTTVSRKEINLKQVVNTNRCLINIEKNGDFAVVHSAIDNLLKGASGQAIHNMNISFGFPENAGLKLKSIAF
jgi:N-acetyl-gamma-glutamyl-phosphate reductase